MELLSGARFTTSYTRVGGMTRDLPDGFRRELRLETAVPHRLMRDLLEEGTG